MTTAKIAPTPLNQEATTRFPNVATRRMEIWEAASADGDWLYVRSEDTGTSWSVEHLPTGRVKHYAAGSLLGCRKLTAERGEALFDTY